jgi:hypothetical protein
MSSIEIHPEESEQVVQAVSLGRRLRNGLCERRRLAFNLAIASTLIIVVFGIGISCGRQAHDGSRKSQCVDEVSSVEGELELGLNTISEWFPEKASMLSANQDDIIDYIMNVTDPDEHSVLHEPMLIVPVDRESSAMSMKLLHSENATSVCAVAVAHFFSDLAGFLASLMVVTLEVRLSFYHAILTWVHENVNADQIQALIRQTGEIVNAKGAKARASMIWNALKTSLKRGGSWMKHALYSVVTQAEEQDHWQVTKMCIKMAAMLQMWMKRRAFLAAATFQLLSNQSIVSSGREALRVCPNVKELPQAGASRLGFAVQSQMLTSNFPNFPCTNEGASELVDKYKMARVDASNGPNEIGQLLTDEATYKVPLIPTYRGKHAVVNEYLKKHPARLDSEYRNDVVQPITITKAGTAAQVTMLFDTWNNWWAHTAPARPATASLACVDARWMIEGIVVA